MTASAASDRLHPAGADENLDPSFTIGSQLVEPLRVSLGI